MGKLQVVSRHPLVLAASSPTQQCSSTTTATPCCCVGTSGGRLVSRTRVLQSYLDSTDSGASQRGWSGTSIRASSYDWSGTYIRAEARWSGTYTRADSQGWLGTYTRADVRQHRPSPTFSDDLRRPPTTSGALRLSPTRLRRFPTRLQRPSGLQHIPPALRIDIHHRTLPCAHAQTS